MDGQMKLDGDKVRALREEKSWSQEHLARAAGLSGRTIQRVEVEGVASAETRLALAAALGVPVAELLGESPLPVGPVAVARRVPLWGWLGWAVGIVCSMGVVLYGYRQGAFPVGQIVVNVLPWLAFLGILVGVLSMRASWRR